MNPDFTNKHDNNAMFDLNRFDEELFDTSEPYQAAVRSSPVGVAIEALSTSLTLQDCCEFLGIVQPSLLLPFLEWAAKNYPEFDINPSEAAKLVQTAIQENEIGIQRP